MAHNSRFTRIMSHNEVHDFIEGAENASTKRGEEHAIQVLRSYQEHLASLDGKPADQVIDFRLLPVQDLDALLYSFWPNYNVLMETYLQLDRRER